MSRFAGKEALRVWQYERDSAPPSQIQQPDSRSLMTCTNETSTPATGTGEIQTEPAGPAKGDAARPAASLPASDGPTIQPQYVTLKTAAASVELSAGTLKRAIRAGKLRAFKPGGKLLIRPEDLQEWVETRPAQAIPMPVSDRPARSDSLIDQVLARRVESA
jgi:excisionase family DNA binding protein